MQLRTADLGTESAAQRIVAHIVVKTRRWNFELAMFDPVKECLIFLQYGLTEGRDNSFPIMNYNWHHTETYAVHPSTMIPEAASGQ